MEVRVCTKEMYLIFCCVHNGDMGEGHRGQNATWNSLNRQHFVFLRTYVMQHVKRVQYIYQYLLATISPRTMRSGNIN